MTDSVLEVESSLSVVLLLATSTGGVGRHVAALAAGLESRGHRVVVMAPKSVDSMFGFAAVARFVPVDIADRPRPWHDARAAWRIRQTGRRADVLHAHGIRAGLVACVSQLGRRTPRPVLVVTWHNALLGARGRSRFARFLERYVARRADLVLAVSADLVAHLQPLGDSPIGRAVIAAPTRDPGRPVADVRAELGAADSTPVVLAVGRLHPQKGFDVLIAAASRLALAAPPLVVIAGDGPARLQLERAISTSEANVRLLGHREDVADLLRAADVVVMPSRWEGWPLAAAEVLRRGRPLVATQVGGLPELVGDAALLVAPDDPVALAAAISQVLDDPSLAASLATAALARAAELPSDDDVTAAALESYLQALARRRTPP